MSVRQLSGRERRTLAVGAFIILALIVGRQGVPAILAWQREAREAFSQNEERLVRARTALARERQVRDSAKARGARVSALAPSLLAGDSPATASAALAGIVSVAAARANVRVGSLQLNADTTTHATFTRIGVHGDVMGDIAGITSMLAALEGGPTLLAVRDLSITQPEPAGPADHAEALRVELTVVGLMFRRPSVAR